MAEVCFVTSNRHKYEEVLEVAIPLNIKLDYCGDMKLEFQGIEIEEIVAKSAMLAYIYLNRPVLVEDAGLFIDALNGFPGPYSSYVYKTIGISGLLKLLHGVTNRKAHFKSAAAIALKNKLLLATGVVYGEITNEPRGVRGIGFDPIFAPDGNEKTFAE
ncbi:MAG: non-canonical purine NTP pyrophosphatase, partial [Desulfurococcaceae archaeon]